MICILGCPSSALVQSVVGHSLVWAGLCLMFWFNGVDSFISWAVTSRQWQSNVTFASSSGLYNEENITYNDFTSFLLIQLWRIWLLNPQARRNLTEGYHKATGVVWECQSNHSHSQTVPPGREEALPHTLCVHQRHTAAFVCVNEGPETDWKQKNIKDAVMLPTQGIKEWTPRSAPPLSPMPKPNPLHHLHPDPAVCSSHP